MLRSLIADYDPEYMAVVFDARGKTFRHELYSEYKANRPSMPDELAVQVEPLHAVVRAMGLPLLQVSGVEADDVIGTLATQASAKGMDTVISTGDKDMAQLVDAHTTLVNTMSRTTLDAAGVAEKFGVQPAQIIDYLALMGDSSDNIPGVPKVGPKTAAKWLTSYGSLDAIMAHAAEVKGKVGESLREHLEMLPLSRELATIRRDLSLETGPETLHMQAQDTERLRESLYQPRLYPAAGRTGQWRRVLSRHTAGRGRGRVRNGADSGAAGCLVAAPAAGRPVRLRHRNDQPGLHGSAARGRLCCRDEWAGRLYPPGP